MKSKRAFTLIELLVVIAIIGLLATISVIALNNARAKARDAKRVADVKQVQTALELFFNDEGRYPTADEFNAGTIASYTTSTGVTTTYMSIIPAAASPADGNCSPADNQYVYSASSDGTSYTLSYCLGGPTGSLAAGSNCATPGGISTGGICGSVVTAVDPCFTDPSQCSWQSVGDFSGVTAGSLAFYNDSPYITYKDNSSNVITEKFANSSWETLVNPTLSCGGMVPIAGYTMDPSLYADNNIPYVAYQDSCNGNVGMVEKFSNGSWNTIGDPFSDTNAYDLSLTVANGTPYVAYTDIHNSNAAVLKKFNGSAWESVGGPISDAIGSYPSLQISNGVPYVAYSTFPPGMLPAMVPYSCWLRTFDGHSWQTVGGADFSDNCDRLVSLSIDNNIPYVAYIDRGGGLRYSAAKVVVKKINNGSWETVGTGDISDNNADYASLYVYNGTPYVAYSNCANNCEAVVKKFDGTDWVNVGANSISPGEADNISLSVRNGTAYIAFIDNSSGQPAVMELSPTPTQPNSF